MDTALAKGDPEAIAESFYASLWCQQQPGGQKNENLVRRTKVNWCLPSLVNCESIISEAVSIYHKEDEKILPHRANTFFTDRAKKYKTSKVIDHINSKGCCPFLFNWTNMVILFGLILVYWYFVAKHYFLFIAIFYKCKGFECT